MLGALPIKQRFMRNRMRQHSSPSKSRFKRNPGWGATPGLLQIKLRFMQNPGWGGRPQGCLRSKLRFICKIRPLERGSGPRAAELGARRRLGELLPMEKTICGGFPKSKTESWETRVGGL